MMLEQLFTLLLAPAIAFGILFVMIAILNIVDRQPVHRPESQDVQVERILRLADPADVIRVHAQIHERRERLRKEGHKI